MISYFVAKSVDSLRFCRVDASLEGCVEAEDFGWGGCRGLPALFSTFPSWPSHICVDIIFTCLSSIIQRGKPGIYFRLTCWFSHKLQAAIWNYWFNISSLSTRRLYIKSNSCSLKITINVSFATILKFETYL